MGTLFCNKTSMHNIKPVVLSVYATNKEKICLDFHPVLMTGQSPLWEDWNCYQQPLKIYRSDYDKLLVPYLQELFPLQDPLSGEMQERFDVCFDNWIGKEAWLTFMENVNQDLENKNKQETQFYQSLLLWLERALQETDVIVVDGNQ